MPRKYTRRPSMPHVYKDIAQGLHSRKPDIQLRLHPSGKISGASVPVGLGVLSSLANSFRKAIAEELDKIGIQTRLMLLAAYRDKIGGFAGREPTVMEAIEQSLKQVHVKRSESEVTLNLFDLNMVRTLTSYDDIGRTRFTNLFEMLEFGRNGQVPGSDGWGFVSQELAVYLAQAAAMSQDAWEESEKVEFVADIREAFKGRHGDGEPPNRAGIMVELGKPLFRRAPRWGEKDAEGKMPVRYGYEFAEPHPSRDAFGVVRRLTPGANDALLSWEQLMKSLTTAADIAVKRVARRGR